MTFCTTNSTRYGGPVFRSHLSYARSLTLVTVVLLLLGSSPARLLDRQVREQFAQRWWPSHVTLRIPRRAGPHEDAASVGTYTCRAFLLETPKGPVLMAPLAVVRDHARLDVELHDGRRLWARVPPQDRRHDAPLVRLEWESDTAPPGLTALKWSQDPALGAGRLVWALERPFGVGPEGRSPAPILVDSNLGSAAPHPLERYWTVTLRSAVGAPLLDANGDILCVVFRPFGQAPVTGLCTTQPDALQELGP